jgi:hypothetical protein
VKGQTILADIPEFTDDLGLGAENLDAIVPDTLPRVPSSFSFQRFLPSFQLDRDADGDKRKMPGLDEVKTAIAAFFFFSEEWQIMCQIGNDVGFKSNKS